MIERKKRISSRAFALAATTMMTAVSVTLAAAMLSARGQWQLYAAKSSEKIILETASSAEAQDFKNTVKSKIESMEGVTVAQAGTLTSEDLFGSSPFRRVKLRGGVARIVGGQKAPLLYKAMEQDGIVGAASQQINASLSGQTNQSIIIPAIWASSNHSDERKNPSALPLGKDDPFYEIDCRTSFAALSAYSPSRSSRSSGSNKSGFGNVMVTQTRTFPISAFTSFDFNPQAEMTLESPQIANSEIADVGRIYSSGKVKFANTLPISASQIIAIGGIESIHPPPPENPTSMLSAQEYDEEVLKAENEFSSKKSEIMLALEEKINSEYGGNKSDKEAQLKTLEAYAEVSKKEYEKTKKINELRAQLSLAAREQIFATSPSSGTSSPNSSLDNRSGGRFDGRKVTISDPTSSESGTPFAEKSDSVSVPSTDLNARFKEERLKSLRGALVTEDNGGTRLVRNSAVRDLESLISELSKYADCRIGFSLSAPDPSTGLRHPVVYSGGVALRADTQKPLDPGGRLLGDGASSGAPFYWVRGEDNAPGGMLVFDPSRLSFSSALGSSSPTRPFSIVIDTSGLLDLPRDQQWHLFIAPSQSVEGLSIISKQPLNIAGNFLTQLGSIPSMLLSPDIVACKSLSAEKQIEESSPFTRIEATVITSAPSPITLLKKTSWSVSGSERMYPSSPEFSKIVGSSVVWGPSSDTSSLRVETLALAPSPEILTGKITPALVPAVAEVRISASSPTNKKVGFTSPGS